MSNPSNGSPFWSPETAASWSPGARTMVVSKLWPSTLLTATCGMSLKAKRSGSAPLITMSKSQPSLLLSVMVPVMLAPVSVNTRSRSKEPVSGPPMLVIVPVRFAVSSISIPSVGSASKPIRPAMRVSSGPLPLNGRSSE